MKRHIINFILFCRLVLLEIFMKPFLRKHPKYDKKYNVSICAIFKDEALNLKEWLEYHLLIGVEHFYMYNNGSTDNYQEILNDYIEEGLVTLIDYPGEKAQLKAYNDFFLNRKYETQWVSFLDIDEFVCPNTDYDIMSWIKKYERFPVILIYWKMFGTSGLMEQDKEKLLIEQYHICWERLYHVGKCFFNTDYEIANSSQSFHHEPFVYYKIAGFTMKVPPVNQFKRVAISEKYVGSNRKEDNPSIQINHYWSKAWKQYDAKRNRPSVCRGELKNRMNYFLWHEHKNCSTDYNIYRYIMQLKLRLNNIK